MKVVNVRNFEVIEIIPDYALPVEKWYGEKFAEHCMEAPDEVEPGWIYDPETETWSEPTPEPEPAPEPTAQDDIDAMIVDHEYRITLLELGVI